MRRYLGLVPQKALLIAVTLAFFGTALWFWLRPLQVMTAEVSAREISPVIQGVGTVEAKMVVQLAAKIAGRVVIMKVDQGRHGADGPDACSTGRFRIERRGGTGGG